MFSLEQIKKLKSEGHAIDVGTTGENITIEGIDWPTLEVGTRMMIGEAMIELSEPTAPCSKIGKSFIDGAFSRIDHELEVGWSRWSASVIEEGGVEVGNSGHSTIMMKYDCKIQTSIENNYFRPKFMRSLWVAIL